MKILITLFSFKNLTGSELWAYEMSRELVKQGHKVTILSQIDYKSEICKKASMNGVSVQNFSFYEPPQDIDLIIACHKPIVEAVLRYRQYKNTPIISVIHSEIIGLEEPVIEDRILHYVAIRDSIKQKLINLGLDGNKISVIPNPVDKERFPLAEPMSRKTVLFVGTLDALRKNTIFDLCKKSQEEDFDLIFCGEILCGDISGCFRGNIRYKYPHWDTCIPATHTASILMGRTEIEGWFRGLPCYEYQIDSHGRILDMQLRNPPNDMSDFDCEQVVKKYLNLYHDISKKRLTLQG